jgi:hypothetical protein
MKRDGASGFHLVLVGPNEQGGEMWAYGPPGEPIRYDDQKEAEGAALSLAEEMQREVAVFVATKPWKAVSVARFRNTPESEPSSASPKTTRRSKSRGSRK